MAGSPIVVDVPGNDETNVHNFELNMETDDYPHETKWVLFLSGTEYASGGPYVTPSEQVTFSMELPEGEYELVFYDSAGDGICCDYGNGSFEAKLHGNFVASGGEFSYSTSTSFTNGEVTGAPPSDGTNLGNFELNVKTDNYPEENTWMYVGIERGRVVCEWWSLCDSEFSPGSIYCGTA